MEKDYYTNLPTVGRPILELLEVDFCLTCRNTIYRMEAKGWNFSMLNVVKYLWRAGQKTPDPRDDLQKAIQYLTWEKERYRSLPPRHSKLTNNAVDAFILRYALAIDACNLAIQEQNRLFITDKDLSRYQQKHGHG